jgi:hypothetical protein
MRFEMEYRNVKSSSLTRVGYDLAARTLEVTFTSGRIYQYDQVPKETADGLLNAKSKGQFLAESIVGKFTYRCLNPLPKKEKHGKPEKKKEESVCEPKAKKRIS